MDVKEIEAKLEEFEKKLKPIPKGETTLKAEVEAPAPSVPPLQPTEAGQPCFNKCFVDMLKAVKPEFLGSEVSDIVYLFLDQFPTCGVMAS
jgi:hypothetical protein